MEKNSLLSFNKSQWKQQFNKFYHPSSKKLLWGLEFGPVTHSCNQFWAVSLFPKALNLTAPYFCLQQKTIHRKILQVLPQNVKKRVMVEVKMVAWLIFQEILRMLKTYKSWKYCQVEHQLTHPQSNSSHGQEPSERHLSLWLTNICQETQLKWIGLWWLLLVENLALIM